MDNEGTIIKVVMHAGNAHSLAMEAIGLAKGGDFDGAQGALDDAGASLLEAHKYHAELLSLDARDELEIRLLIVHAEDQLSAAALTIGLAREIVELHALLQKRP